MYGSKELLTRGRAEREPEGFCCHFYFGEIPIFISSVNEGIDHGTGASCVVNINHFLPNIWVVIVVRRSNIAILRDDFLREIPVDIAGHYRCSELEFGEAFFFDGALIYTKLQGMLKE